MRGMQMGTTPRYPERAAPARAPEHVGSARRRLAAATTGVRALPRAPVLCAFSFVAGAVFWHLVGFWSFMADILVKGPPPRTALLAPDAVDPKVRLERLTAVRIEPSCSALVRDRFRGTTSVAPCSSAGPALPLASELAQRQDLEPARALAATAGASPLTTGSIARSSP